MIRTMTVAGRLTIGVLMLTVGGAPVLRASCAIACQRNGSLTSPAPSDGSCHQMSEASTALRMLAAPSPCGHDHQAAGTVRDSSAPSASPIAHVEPAERVPFIGASFAPLRDARGSPPDPSPGRLASSSLRI